MVSNSSSQRLGPSLLGSLLLENQDPRLDTSVSSTAVSTDGLENRLDSVAGCSIAFSRSKFSLVSEVTVDALTLVLVGLLAIIVR